MADARQDALNLQLANILHEARSRWLRPGEICDIIRNYQRFDLTADPPCMPTGGSLFLFDRKTLRNFRKDSHNWKRKKDGKSLLESHVKLKCGSVDVLHCYYAHGENNENFQRRSYWMLDGRLEHIVLVHYRDINEPSGSSISPHTLTTDQNRINQQELQTEPVRFAQKSSNSNASSFQLQQSSLVFEEDSGEDLGRHAAPLDEASAGFNFAPLPRESPLMKERFTGLPSPIHNIYTDDFMSKGLSFKDLIFSSEQQKTSIASKVKLTRETEEASARKRKSMEGASAAAASSGCDYDKTQPKKKIPIMVDAISAPSTSSTNPSPEPSFVPSLEEGCCTIGFNEDSMQGIEKQMTPFVGGKEPLSALAAEYQSNSVFLKKIQVLSEKYTALRRIRGDGNCFYRSFLFSYLEHILVTQNRVEMERVMLDIEKCRMDLVDLGYPFYFEDFFSLFKELLKNCLPGTETSLSQTDLLGNACDQMTSDCAVMFLRFITSAAMQKRAQFFEPFVIGSSHKSVTQFCKICVEPMGQESDHVHIIALCGALGVPIRVGYLNASSSGNPANTNAPSFHDFLAYNQEEVQNNGSNSTDAANVSTDLSKQENPAPSITLLYRPGHYDILYPM